MALPKASEVPPGQPLPVDGLYLLDFNSAQYRFDRGRIIVVTPYNIAVLFRVERDDVVDTDIVRAAPGVYVGYDHVLTGKWEGRLQPDGTIKVKVTGVLLPFEGVFTPLQLVDPAWQQREIAEMQGLSAPQVQYGSPPQAQYGAPAVQYGAPSPGQYGLPAPAQYGSRSGPDNADSIYPPGWDAR